MELSAPPPALNAGEGLGPAPPAAAAAAAPATSAGSPSREGGEREEKKAGGAGLAAAAGEDEAERRDFQSIQSRLQQFSREILDRTEQEMRMQGLYISTAANAELTGDGDGTGAGAGVGAIAGAGVGTADGAPAVDFTPDPERLFEHNYIVATWRRSPYITGAFPQCLIGSSASEVATLGNFDGHGSIWRFVQLEHVSGNFSAALECCEIGEKPLYLTYNLELSAEPAQAAEWTLELTNPFRGGALDIPLKIRCSDGRLLCSNERDGRVALVSDELANERDARGCYIWNNAWECSPEIAVPMEGLDFLDEELAGDSRHGKRSGIGSGVMSNAPIIADAHMAQALLAHQLGSSVAATAPGGRVRTDSGSQGFGGDSDEEEEDDEEEDDDDEDDDDDDDDDDVHDDDEDDDGNNDAARGVAPKERQGSARPASATAQEFAQSFS